MVAVPNIESEENSKKADVKHIDDFLNFGKYSIVCAVLCEVMMLNQAGNLFYMAFAGAPPILTGCRNQTLPEWKESELCELYHNGKCDPILEYQLFSINVHWNMICSDGKQVKDSISYQMFGYIIGSLFTGQISDKYGRKWPMFIYLLGTFVFGIASSFSPNLLIFTILRTIISIFSAGHICTAAVFTCETFPQKHRMWITFIISWSPNMILLTGIAYFCGDWQKFSIVLNSLAGIACIILWFTYETCYWLVRKGRVVEAVENLRKISKFDGNHLEVEDLRMVLEAEKKCFLEKNSMGTYSYLHLFSSWKLASYTWTIGFSYFAISVVHYGILFNMETVSGSMYVNMIFFGIVRFVLNLLSACAEYNFKCVGRKLSHLIFSTYSSLSILTILGIQAFNKTDVLDEAIRFLSITCCSVICQIYAVNIITTSEIFPTPIRNIAYALLFVCESIGTVFGPQIFELNSLHSMPYIVMFILSVSQFIFFIWFIPESKGKPLADTMPGPEERIFKRKRVSGDELREVKV